MQRGAIIGIVAGILGVVLVVVGAVVGWVVVPHLVDKTVRKEAKLENGTEIYEKWETIPVPIYLNCYLFNVTNAHEYQSGRDGDWSAKPQLNEIGPYVYKETRVKYAITSNKDADTISFRQNVTYHFVPELSAGPETDLVNIINGPLLSVVTVLSTIPRNLLPIPYSSIMELLLGPLSGERYIKQHLTVKDAIFGWRLNVIYDIFIAIAKSVYKIKFPLEMSDGQFGAYLNRNGTNFDGLWEVFSGVKDISKIAMLKTLNGIDHHVDQVWNGDCNKVNGTDGTYFPPFIKKDTILTSYIPEACRSVWLVYEKEIELEGIPGYRFHAPNELFTSPNIYKPNACYCMETPPPLNGTCDFTGVVKLATCKSGAPAVASKPHFLDSDQSIIVGVDGMAPNRELHDTYIDVEPTLGLPLRGHKRIQIGIQTQPIPIGPPWNTIPHLFFPMLWTDEEAQVTDELIEEVKSKMVRPLKLANIGRWTAIGIGTTAAILGSLSFAYFTWWKST